MRKKKVKWNGKKGRGKKDNDVRIIKVKKNIIHDMNEKK